MFEKNNESQMPLIDKTATFQQMTNNFSKACEYINSNLDIDNAIAKEDVLAMVKETESIVIEMYSKAKEIETQSTAVKMNDIKKEIDEEFKMFSDTIQSDNVNALKSIEDKKGKLKEISEIAFTEGENERKMRIEFRYNINKVMNEAIDSLNTI